MFCGGCAKQIADDARFCRFCGRGTTNNPNAPRPITPPAKQSPLISKQSAIRLLVTIGVLIMLTCVFFLPWEENAFHFFGRIAVGGLWIILFLGITIVVSFRMLSELYTFQVKQAATPSGQLGDAGIASTRDLTAAGLLGPKLGEGIRLGFDEASGQVIRYSGEAHGLLVAPARSGKFRDMLCAMMLEWKHSAVVIDPKGQICAVTKKQRETLGEVFVLNPFNILPEQLGPSAFYNPMDVLIRDEIDTECATLADAVVVHEGGGEKHWSDSARLLITGAMMHLALNYPKEDRNLGYLRRVVTDPDELANFVASAINIGDDFTKRTLSRFAQATSADNKGELQSIISNADTQTGFITRAIAANLEQSSFRFGDLKQRPITVYVVLPTRYLNSAGKWFRLIVASALNELMREERGLPVLAVWDEFAQLGHLKAMRNAMGQSAGMGLQMIPVLQDLNQLKHDYEDGWETFLANADFRQFYAANDVFTQEYVSKLSGVTTIKTKSTSVGGGPNGLGSSTTFSDQQKPVLYPHDVGRIGPNEFLMFARGVKNVIRGRRAPYFDGAACPELKGLYSPDPYHLKTHSAPQGA